MKIIGTSLNERYSLTEQAILTKQSLHESWTQAS